MFFTFDGIDGTGKSTQLALFCDWLRQTGREVVTCRDPGSTRLGEKLRSIVVEGDTTPVAERSETLIYMAARAQLVHELIRPMLDDGKIVVSDRFLLANVVYQAYGLDLDAQQVWTVGEFATGGLEPYKTFLLDLDVGTAMARLSGQADRMERRSGAYLERVRKGFLVEAAKRPDQIAVILADRTIDAVQQEIREIAKSLLG